MFSLLSEFRYTGRR